MNLKNKNYRKIALNILKNMTNSNIYLIGVPIFFYASLLINACSTEIAKKRDSKEIIQKEDNRLKSYNDENLDIEEDTLNINNDLNKNTKIITPENPQSINTIDTNNTNSYDVIKIPSNHIQNQSNLGRNTLNTNMSNQAASHQEINKNISNNTQFQQINNSNEKELKITNDNINIGRNTNLNNDQKLNIQPIYNKENQSLSTEQKHNSYIPKHNLKSNNNKPLVVNNSFVEENKISSSLNNNVRTLNSNNTYNGIELDSPISLYDDDDNYSSSNDNFSCTPFTDDDNLPKNLPKLDILTISGVKKRLSIRNTDIDDENDSDLEGDNIILYDNNSESNNSMMFIDESDDEEDDEIINREVDQLNISGTLETIRSSDLFSEYDIKVEYRPDNILFNEKSKNLSTHKKSIPDKVLLNEDEIKNWDCVTRNNISITVNLTVQSKYKCEITWNWNKQAISNNNQLNQPNNWSCQIADNGLLNFLNNQV